MLGAGHLRPDGRMLTFACELRPLARETRQWLVEMPKIAAAAFATKLRYNFIVAAKCKCHCQPS